MEEKKNSAYKKLQLRGEWPKGNTGTVVRSTSAQRSAAWTDLGELSFSCSCVWRFVRTGWGVIRCIQSY